MLIINTYHLYFGCQVSEQDKPWASRSCCTQCARNLGAWVKGTRKRMSFATSMIWCEPKNHIDECYICIAKIKGFSAKSKHKIKYPNLHSAMRPVTHNDELPVPKPPENFTYGNAAVEMEIDEVETSSTSSEINYVTDINEEPHLITPEELNDLVRDFNLSKNTQNYLDHDCKVGISPKITLTYPFSKIDIRNIQGGGPTKGNLCYCNYIRGLTSALKCQYNSEGPGMP
ncbi:hypothetical protein AVEN_141184-1 [Araneus ventricosus]|uniref:Uncharacterized protein n=1 Tax=Araneus ventricosus TaxID=182803 RepID=A0A4Y2EUA9_ARAVE|nr:hypothetical protein AVEN_141184-1 [Araneus ventricosus]